MALVEFLPLLTPMFMFALIGALSIFWYTKTRRTGFAWIGTGFLVEIIPSLIRLALGGPYLAMRLVIEQGLSPSEIGQFFFLLYLVETAVSVGFTVLVLVGLVSLAREVQR